MLQLRSYLSHKFILKLDRIQWRRSNLVTLSGQHAWRQDASVTTAAERKPDRYAACELARGLLLFSKQFNQFVKLIDLPIL